MNTTPLKPNIYNIRRGVSKLSVTLRPFILSHFYDTLSFCLTMEKCLIYLKKTMIAEKNLKAGSL